MTMNIFRLTAIALAVGLLGQIPAAKAAYNDNLICMGAINESARISRKQLQQLQEIPFGVRLNLEPYCLLQSEEVTTEQGEIVEIQRTLHPFEWEPSNGLVIHWRDNTYAGYDFRLLR